MMTDMDIFGSILAIFMFSGLLYVKSELDVALREFARQVVRGLLITLRVVERK